jgi:hypothetical protein
MPLNYYSTTTKTEVKQTCTTSYCSGSAMYFYTTPSILFI